MAFDILAWAIKFKYILLFYLILAIILYFKRKKLDIQGKVIILYRTKWGMKWMDKYAAKYREWVILLGYVGAGVGFMGLIAISVILAKNLYDLIMHPATTPGVSLVLPGVNVPGLGILPFWYWIISIFVTAIVHEFSHGIVARAHNNEVKNTGLVFLGPILGAFVEPNEKKLRKENDIKQYSVLAAGSFSNILLAVIALLLLNLAFTPLQNHMVTQTGFTFDSYFGEQYPFAQAGISTGTIITGLNDKKINNFQELSDELNYYKPGDKVTIKTSDKAYPIVLGTNPDNARKPFLGIKEVRNEFDVKEQYGEGVGKVWYGFVDWMTGLLRWLFVLSFGIALFNLLPLPIVDGGRMAQVFLWKVKGMETGEKRYRQIALFFLLLLILNLVYPWISKLF